ncbi:hypothetical protein, partial [Myxococcus xanthus]|uniref:hypothetical protein n=1 Tax=Myxococcus xanthus TaxID=34 RepID=UPI001C12440D
VPSPVSEEGRATMTSATAASAGTRPHAGAGLRGGSPGYSVDDIESLRQIGPLSSRAWPPAGSLIPAGK